MQNLPGSFLATYKLQPHHEFSERHAVYVEDVAKVEGLPPPHPPDTSKEEIFDIKQYIDIDRRADKAPPKLLKEPYTALVNYLVSTAKTDLARTRAIYRWVTAQRLDRILVPEQPPPANTPLHQIWRIKNRKGNYAQLISIMCRLADLPCVIVHGVLKGSTYDVGQKLDDKSHYGEWNAVLIDHQWRLLNAYWGACAIGSEGGDDWMEIDDGDESEKKSTTEGGKEYVYVCDENYFLTDPRQLISTHFPVQREWQLLNEPFTMTQFERMAFLKDRFFNLGMSIISHPESVVFSHSGEVELSFGLPEEDASFLKFYYLLFRQENKSELTGSKPTYDRFVFMHRPNKNELSIRLRSPIAATFRLEIVGRDVRVKEPTYDYDWVALYKMRFLKAKENCTPFPEMPTLGWGPTPYANEMALKPITHHAGEVHTNQRGDAEIAFAINDLTMIAKPAFFGKLKRPGMKDEYLKDRLVHRIEDGKVIFNVKLPKKGEYSLSLNGYSTKGKDKPRNFANYMVVSEQKQYLEPFPPGFEQGLGRKPACEKLGVVPVSHHVGLIYTEERLVSLSFQKPDDVELSATLIGTEIVLSDSYRLVTEDVQGDVIIFTVNLPRAGSYGVRVIGQSECSKFEGVYDYIIEYLPPVHVQEISVQPEGDKILKPLRRGRQPDLKTPSPVTDAENEEGDAPDSSKEDDIRKRVDIAIEAEDEYELMAAAKELQKLGTERALTEKTRVDHELSILKMKRDLVTAQTDRNLKELTRLISLCKERGYNKRMPAEMRYAKHIQERLQMVEKLLHGVRSLNQQTVTEIRHYAHPPAIVHSVMMATLLLLGHFEEETEDWSRVQVIIGRTGKESLKRRCEEFNMDAVALDVALGSRELLKNISMEQVRKVSAGAAAFYVWTKGMVDEMETRYGEQMALTRPRTSQSRRARRKTSTFEHL
ncbi:uncharacterized protein LOC143301800 [Babylonia areolata]|uniref:uncharacterized protein LOC143301800 n=1 Tax=Babylonia areolata TaxID=304850 RepID=UPI003FD12F9B